MSRTFRRMMWKEYLRRRITRQQLAEARAGNLINDVKRWRDFPPLSVVLCTGAGPDAPVVALRAGDDAWHVAGIEGLFTLADLYQMDSDPRLLWCAPPVGVDDVDGHALMVNQEDNEWFDTMGDSVKVSAHICPENPPCVAHGVVLQMPVSPVALNPDQAKAMGAYLIIMAMQVRHALAAASRG